MNLINVDERPDQYELLYRLLCERGNDVSISHHKLPSPDEHRAFVWSRPYEHWLFIVEDGDIVGACYLTRSNEIGISLFREFQGKGLGRKALELLMASYKPLPAIPAVRVGYWLANINPHNRRSIKFFERCGFKLAQLTYKHHG